MDWWPLQRHGPLVCPSRSARPPHARALGPEIVLQLFLNSPLKGKKTG